MPRLYCRCLSSRALLTAATLGCAATFAVPAARAAPEEIVVFTDEFEKRGEVGYELHVNYARHARRTPDYPGEQPPDRVLRVMPEVVIGLSDKWNLGLHLPMSHSNGGGSNTLDGFKARLHYLDSAPTARGSYFYGVNYELNYLKNRLSESRLVAEVRGIVGVRYDGWLVALNPILNRPLNNVPGVDNHVNVDVFAKVAKEVAHEVAIGVEHYAEFGRLRNPTFGPGAGQTTYAIVEFATRRGFDFHIGIGHGWTDPVDKRIYKMMIGLPF